MATTTYEAISPRTKAVVKARLLKNAKARMILEQFGSIDPIPRNSTRTAVWRRYLPFPLAVAPLAEGVTPTGSQLQYEDVTATLQQYGDWCPVTDIVTDNHEDRVLNGVIVPNLSVQSSETIETIRYNILRSGTYATYSGGTSRVTVNGTMTRVIQRKVVRLLKRNRASQITRIMRASAKIATDPIMPAFIGLAHTDLESDLRGMAGYMDVAHYSQDGMLVGEHGKCEEVRYCTSDLFKPWLAAATSTSVTTWLSNGDAPAAVANPDVYPVMIFGEMAYHLVPFAGNDAVEMYVKNPEPTISDPIAQRGFASWKTQQAAAITTQSWFHRVECAVSAEPTA
jgi:N4-gp56 family major capsid protein